MKIAFLCGSLEQGKDGVGDYTIRLAFELIKKGHQPTIVAFKDKYITTEVSSTINYNHIDLPVLRIPFICSEKHRTAVAKVWIDDFNPEWLSLQYVPFSFHRKGVPVGLSKVLLGFGKGRRWHIMFHELWVGMPVHAPAKLVLWGWIQRFLIKSFISKLRPEIIHTQTRLYQLQLNKLHSEAKYLPLFSNIISKRNSYSDSDYNIKGRDVCLVVFGTIHPDVPIEQFAQEVAIYAREKEVKIKLTMIGRCGEEQDKWAAIWKSKGLDLEILGEKPPEVISDVLTSATVGISTNPFVLVEKSGTVAAMREHGLPVICISQPWRPRGVLLAELTNVLSKNNTGILQYDIGKVEACLEGNKEGIHSIGVSGVAEQLSNDILEIQ